MNPSLPFAISIMATTLLVPHYGIAQAKELSQTTRALQITEKWQDFKNDPSTGQDGKVVFMYGSNLPLIVCAPDFLCTIELEKGEMIHDIDIGDSRRWIIKPTTIGEEGSAQTEIILKATEENLKTTMVVSTNRRLYVFNLFSDPVKWMARIAFAYPEDSQRNLFAFKKKQREAKQEAMRKIRERTLSTGQNIEHLDFNYRLSGDSPVWKPLRVYTDFHKTYIQFPRYMKSTEAPALVIQKDNGTLFSEPTRELVNYRVKGNLYIVDRVLTHAALISGVGWSQDLVEIRRVR